MKSGKKSKSYLLVEILVRMMVSSARGRPVDPRRHGIRLRNPAWQNENEDNENYEDDDVK